MASNDNEDEERTTNHALIRDWVDDHDGYPAHVQQSESEGDEGLLRVGFGDTEEESLKEITWEEFFEEFEEKDLAFAYREHVPEEESPTIRLVKRDE